MKNVLGNASEICLCFYFLQPFIALCPCFMFKAAKLQQLPFEIDFVLVVSGGRRGGVDENM